MKKAVALTIESFILFMISIITALFLFQIGKTIYYKVQDQNNINMIQADIEKISDALDKAKNGQGVDIKIDFPQYTRIIVNQNYIVFYYSNPITHVSASFSPIVKDYPIEWHNIPNDKGTYRVRVYYLNQTYYIESFKIR